MRMIDELKIPYELSCKQTLSCFSLNNIVPLQPKMFRLLFWFFKDSAPLIQMGFKPLQIHLHLKLLRSPDWPDHPVGSFRPLLVVNYLPFLLIWAACDQFLCYQHFVDDLNHDSNNTANHAHDTKNQGILWWERMIQETGQGHLGHYHFQRILKIWCHCVSLNQATHSYSSIM